MKTQTEIQKQLGTTSCDCNCHLYTNTPCNICIQTKCWIPDEKIGVSRFRLCNQYKHNTMTKQQTTEEKK